jgi:hypothetical protein
MDITQMHTTGISIEHGGGDRIGIVLDRHQTGKHSRIGAGAPCR